MLDALQVLWQSVKDIRNQGYAYIWANVAFVALSLPLVTAPAAMSALFRVGHAAQREAHEADLGLFWETFRENLWRTLPWGALHALFAFINFTNLLYFNPGETEPSVWLLRSIWVGISWVWLAVLLYTFPIYYEMKSPTFVGATRNALVMILQNPFFTFVIILTVLLLLFISTILVASWLLLTFGVIAAISNIAVLNRLDVYREKMREEA